jgi:DNA-directed RNA polymerase specialized sigma24 family protein
MQVSDTAAHWSPAGQSDAALISGVRAGDLVAYGLLCERHVAAARVLARHVVAGARSGGDADASADAVEDAVAETFTRILGALRRGGGPHAGFRPYLLASLRRTVGERVRGERRRPPSEAYVDPALATNMIARAFLSLPECWQAVLWHTEIEGGRPGVVAPLLGLTPNGAAGLAYAAREGLRQAYLQLYLAESARRSCRPALDKLPAYIRGGLAGHDSARVERHLDGCRDCATIYTELANARPVLRAIVGPLLLGGGAAGYLAEITGGGQPRTARRPLGTGGGLRRAWRQRPRRQRRVLGVDTAATRQ